MLAGFDGPSQTLAPNSAAAYFPLKSFEERGKLGVNFEDIMNQARANTADITEAQIVIIPPPLIQGIGSAGGYRMRSEEHTSELQSLMRISYAVFCLKKKNNRNQKTVHTTCIYI